MDLNHLFSQHQRSLMLAQHGPCDASRAGHRASAAGIAGRIGDTQRRSGALAPMAGTRA